MAIKDWLTERFLIDKVAQIAPWLTPIPTAYLVGTATIEHLKWPPIIAVTTAIIIESLGLATTTTTLMLREYNKTKRKSDPIAPFHLSAALVAIYLSVAIGLTILLDINPSLALFSPAIFPLLSLCGMIILAMRSDHRERVQIIMEDKAEQKRARDERRAAKLLEVSPTKVSTPKLDKAGRREAILRFYKSNGDGNFAEFVKNELDVTYETARKDRELLLSKEGPLVKLGRGSYYVLEEDDAKEVLGRAD